MYTENVKLIRNAHFLVDVRIKFATHACRLQRPAFRQSVATARNSLDTGDNASAVQAHSGPDTAHAQVAMQV